MSTPSAPSSSAPRGFEGRGDGVRLLHVATTDMSLELLIGPQLRAFAAAGYDVHTASAPGPYVERLVADGIAHHTLHHATRAFRPDRDAAAAAELYRLFRRLRPDIVHTHNPKPGVYGRVAARVARVPLVVNTQHGLYAQPADRWGRRVLVYGLERLAASCSDVELIQNEEDLETLARLGVPRSRLRLLGSGVDLGRFRPPTAEERAEIRSSLDIAEDEVVVGAIGRLVWEKGYRDLFDAVGALRGRTERMRVIVAGPIDPDKGDAITQEDLNRAEEDGVQFLGMRDDPEHLYWAMDLYVLASLREGYPRSAMEASASGLAVVATDIRGCRQVVDDERTGLLVPPRSPQGLAEAISRLVADEPMRSQLGLAGRAKAVSDFDQRALIDRTLDAYGLLGSRHP